MESRAERAVVGSGSSHSRLAPSRRAPRRPAAVAEAAESASTGAARDDLDHRDDEGRAALSGDSGSDAGPASPSIGSFALYATEAIELNSTSLVTGCNIGVENTTGPFLGGGAAAYFNSGATIQSSQTPYAWLARRSAGDVAKTLTWWSPRSRTQGHGDEARESLDSIGASSGARSKKVCGDRTRRGRGRKRATA